MKSVSEIMEEALLNGACDKSKGVSGWKTLVWLFFTPQGLEFCEENNFPSLENFREIKSLVSDFGVFVDKGKIIRSNDSNIALVGNTEGRLVFDDNTKIHKVVLMHGAKAFIIARNYAVVRLVNIGDCNVIISKDKTSVILK